MFKKFPFTDLTITDTVESICFSLYAFCPYIL